MNGQLWVWESKGKAHRGGTGYHIKRGNPSAYYVLCYGDTVLAAGRTMTRLAHAADKIAAGRSAATERYAVVDETGMLLRSGGRRVSFTLGQSLTVARDRGGYSIPVY